jgi:hypothetical protein
MFAAWFKPVTFQVALWPGLLPRFVVKTGEIGRSGRSARTLPMAPSSSSTNELEEEDHYGLPESARNERKW